MVVTLHFVCYSSDACSACGYISARCQGELGLTVFSKVKSLKPAILYESLSDPIESTFRIAQIYRSTCPLLLLSSSSSEELVYQLLIDSLCGKLVSHWSHF